ncbi:hypothetical protein EVAR_27205_1 [Eumeta japonica]|uniref:Uncharacterized protein n=1 Tax=Eumeta variegata TaxID=151549 RepID=A0A4C1VWW7_EUMVA|nr:hypothetical protein EVAR_27205_1 [Eumeta japonica]
MAHTHTYIYIYIYIYKRPRVERPHGCVRCLSIVRPRNPLIRLVGWSAYAEVVAGHSLCPTIGMTQTTVGRARLHRRYPNGRPPGELLHICKHRSGIVGRRRASSGVIGLGEMSPDGTNNVRVFSTPGQQFETCR